MKASSSWMKSTKCNLVYASPPQKLRFSAFGFTFSVVLALSVEKCAHIGIIKGRTCAVMAIGEY